MPTTETTRKITHAEAADAARRLIAGAWRYDGQRVSDDRRPFFSIPADPQRDNDLVLTAYLVQQEAADLVAAHTDEEDRLANGNVLKRPSITEGFRPVGETWVETLRREDLSGLRQQALGTAGLRWRGSAFALARALEEQTARAARLERDLLLMSLDELVALRERVRNCAGVVVGNTEAAS